jgi:hypothetical protein
MPRSYNRLTTARVAKIVDAEHAAATRAVRRTIDEDRFPHAPRLAPLRSALAKLEPAWRLTTTGT